MSDPGHAQANTSKAAFLASVNDLRPALHRYCARLMGSVIDGEDIVQDALAKAIAAVDALQDLPPARPWLFQIAHNRALDVLRGQAHRQADALDEAVLAAVDSDDDPAAALLREEAVRVAVQRFTALPVQQRSVVILKDVLGESLADIGALLGISIDAVKAHLARGRARLRLVNAQASAETGPGLPSVETSRYVALFNRGDWDALRALLADDVRLNQATYPARAGIREVGMFFGIYSRFEGLRVAPAWLEGREVIAVFERDATEPAYFMWLTWHEGRIAAIRDFRYVRYIVRDAALQVADG